MRRCLFVIVLVLLIISSDSCASLSEEQKRQYGILESAVTFSSDKVIGEYGDTIPDDFLSDKFMRFIKNRIPEDYYEVLKKYHIDIKPKGSYYLLLIFDPISKSLILFDYSCSPEVDGPILLEPGKYDINNLELYDKCKKLAY